MVEHKVTELFHLFFHDFLLTYFVTFGNAKTKINSKYQWKWICLSFKTFYLRLFILFSLVLCSLFADKIIILLLSHSFNVCSRWYNVIDLGTGDFRYGKCTRFVCFSAIQKIFVVLRAQVPRVAITGHQIVEVCRRYVKCPTVRRFHVLFCSFMGFCIYVDQHFCTRAQKRAPYSPALFGNI